MVLYNNENIRIRCVVMRKLSWSNAVLKNIAYAIMFIDHFFAVVFTEIIQRYSAAGYETGRLIQIRSAGRAVGRLSFILFAYLAVESFVHTRSRRNYLLRLGLFALVSEVPFDLAFYNKVIDYTGQNIFFTLFIGVLVLAAWEWAGQSMDILKKSRARRDYGWYLCAGVFWGIRLGTLVLGCGMAYFLRTDYKYMGVLLIFVFYIFRDRPFYEKILPAACVMFFGMWSINCLRYAGTYTVRYLARFSMRELYGLFAFIPIALYDGTRGRQLPKAVCYGFYPLHLLLLHSIARGIAGM